MIAPNEDALTAGPGGSGEPSTPILIAGNAPSPMKPLWQPARTMDGTELPPSKYAVFGSTPGGLLDWARINQDYLGISGFYNAAVLMQAAGSMTALQSDLEAIKRHLPTLRRVLNGESLHNEAVRHAFQDAIDAIASHTVSVEVVTTEATTPAA